MCKFSWIGEEAGQGERCIATLLAAADGDRVAEQLAPDAAGQVPGIAGPEPRALVALDQVRRHRLDSPAQAGQVMIERGFCGLHPK